MDTANRQGINFKRLAGRERGGKGWDLGSGTTCAGGDNLSPLVPVGRAGWRAAAAVASAG